LEIDWLSPAISAVDPRIDLRQTPIQVPLTLLILEKQWDRTVSDFSMPVIQEMEPFPKREQDSALRVELEPQSALTEHAQGTQE